MMTNRIKLVGLFALSLSVFGLAGCPSSSHPFVGEVYDDAGCQEGCDRCPPLALCISAPYKPACLLPCATVADCGAGQMCAKLDLSPESSNVCIGGLTGQLSFCSQPTTCDRPAMCQDANTLLTPLPDLARICGWAVTHCDSGCDSTTAKCN